MRFKRGGDRRHSLPSPSWFASLGLRCLLIGLCASTHTHTHTHTRLARKTLCCVSQSNIDDILLSRRDHPSRTAISTGRASKSAVVTHLAHFRTPFCSSFLPPPLPPTHTGAVVRVVRLRKYPNQRKPSSSHSISILTNISTQFLLQSFVCVCVGVSVCVCVHLAHS